MAGYLIVSFSPAYPRWGSRMGPGFMQCSKAWRVGQTDGAPLGDVRVADQWAVSALMSSQRLAWQ